MATALLIFALLFGAITLFLRRSSRGHRLLVESALLLLFALPVVGTTAIADLNRELDRAASVQLSRKIVQVEQRRRWWSKRRSYSYYLHLEGPSSAEPITLSSPLEVSHGMYLRAFPGRHVEFEIGPGWLGMPWYRSIDLR